MYTGVFGCYRYTAVIGYYLYTGVNCPRLYTGVIGLYLKTGMIGHQGLIGSYLYTADSGRLFPGLGLYGLGSPAMFISGRK
jgi:hypothetical protein